MHERNLGITASIVRKFLTSKLSLLFILATLAAGFFALSKTPREEEPQIVVPFADVFVEMPGASASEVENLVASPLESLLWEIDGVEHVYSISREGSAVVTVRFFVGEDRERSLVKIYNKIQSNVDRVPPGVSSWIVKPIEIDDVPIVNLTLFGRGEWTSDYDLRRVAEEVIQRLRETPNTGRTMIVGGRRRQVRVLLDPAGLAALAVNPAEVLERIASANVNVRAGWLFEEGDVIDVDAGPSVAKAEELGGIVVALRSERPVYLRDVASIEDGPEEVESYSRIGFGPAVALDGGVPGEADGFPAVTIGFAKRKGTNAVAVAEEIHRRIEGLRGTVIPDGIEVAVTRDYGETADHKVNELVGHIFVAMLTVVVVIVLGLGWREALVVAIAIPMTFSVALVADLVTGYTINRVTLFALVLSLGLLVDDPIVDVENIHRHFRLRKEDPLKATLTAVNEVRPPMILATFSVILSFLPMFFVTGMMGPYMRPLPFNVSIVMLASLAVALTVTPWAGYHLLRSSWGKEEEAFDLHASPIFKIYRRIMRPMLDRGSRANLFLGAMLLAFFGSLALVPLGLVPMKMLPYDNKNEFQIMVDMPEGTSLETTDAVVRDLEDSLRTAPEVVNFVSTVGDASPMDFNGMVRHYYLRRGTHLADIRVNLAPKRKRRQQSHAIALRLRPALEAVARRHDAQLAIVEPPPGPPVLSTLVAEVTPPAEASYDDLIAAAKRVREVFERTPGVVDVDDYVDAPRSMLRFRLDREMAALHGFTVEEIARTLETVLGGSAAGAVHLEGERNPLEIFVRFPLDERTGVGDLQRIRLRSRSGFLVPIAEIGAFERLPEAPAIFHKDLRRTQFVIAEVAGTSPAEAILAMQGETGEGFLPDGFEIEWAGEGEWQITLDVFRDLGIAFGAALVMIYILLVAQTGSLGMPGIIMVAIPITLIGILPGFCLLNLLFERPVGAYADPIFFTATAMIGMIALAGIVVRNSIILIDFIQMQAPRNADELKHAILEGGAVRFRPILLTALTAMMGTWVMTLDPIFSGLAWSFIFGILASTVFTLAVVPLLYFKIFRKTGGPRETAMEIAS